MSEENMNQEFRFKKNAEVRTYLIELINRHQLLSKNQKKVCRVLNYIEHSLILNSTILDVFPFLLLLL